jgi:hypothetical protein
MSQAQDPNSNVHKLVVGGKDGKLTTSGGVPVPVRVFERGSDMLILVLMLDSGKELETDSPESMLLEYVSERGLMRFRGDAALEGTDLVRFTIADEAEVVQRREFVRVETVAPVELATTEGIKALDACAIDISGGGMLLSGTEKLDLELDAEVRFRLDVGTDAPPIEGHARVVRSDGEGRRGLVFDEISSADRQRLIRFVFERQRAALAKSATRGAIPLRRRNGNTR